MTDNLRTIAATAKKISPAVARLSPDEKNNALQQFADMLLAEKQSILAANKIDMDNANDLSAALRDRLLLDEKRITAMAAGVRAIADLADPVGRVLDEWTRPNGLTIKKIACPLGVVLAIYESRPNVAVDIFALTLKSGNVAILRGGSAGFHSSKKLVELMQAVLRQCNLPDQQTQMVMDKRHAAVKELLAMNDYIDVVIPRGGKDLVRTVKQNATMAVFAHEDGNCHVYVDASADVAMATNIIDNAKLRRVGVCGAMETLLLDRAIAGNHMATLVKPLVAGGVALRACPESLRLLQQHNITATPATDEDYFTEFLDKILAVKIVGNVDEAIAHINHYGSHHTDAIVAGDKNTAEKFLKNIDSAIVLHNASTQFADGGEFGFGGEVGIATGKFHARGPVGARELCTYYYRVYGDGQCRP
ncbi:MAG: glutamate-5-semialdehyde dehydrogenase [Hydrotalea sp.]|nr:glutamate-5-semialdehyde dehydrogenase [Hydrotalea sp.]